MGPCRNIVDKQNECSEVEADFISNSKEDRRIDIRLRKASKAMQRSEIRWGGDQVPLSNY